MAAARDVWWGPRARPWTARRWARATRFTRLEGVCLFLRGGVPGAGPRDAIRRPGGAPRHDVGLVGGHRLDARYRSRAGQGTQGRDGSEGKGFCRRQRTGRRPRRTIRVGRRGLARWPRWHWERGLWGGLRKSAGGVAVLAQGRGGWGILKGAAGMREYELRALVLVERGRHAGIEGGPGAHGACLDGYGGRGPTKAGWPAGVGAAGRARGRWGARFRDVGGLGVGDTALWSRPEAVRRGPVSVAAGAAAGAGSVVMEGRTSQMSRVCEQAGICGRRAGDVQFGARNRLGRCGEKAGEAADGGFRSFWHPLCVRKTFGLGAVDPSEDTETAEPLPMRAAARWSWRRRSE